jgi:hypothetical protein
VQNSQRWAPARLGHPHEGQVTVAGGAGGGA